MNPAPPTAADVRTRLPRLPAERTLLSTTQHSPRRGATRCSGSTRCRRIAAMPDARSARDTLNSSGDARASAVPAWTSCRDAARRPRREQLLAGQPRHHESHRRRRTRCCARPRRGTARWHRDVVNPTAAARPGPAWPRLLRQPDRPYVTRHPPCEPGGSFDDSSRKESTFAAR